MNRQFPILVSDPKIKPYRVSVLRSTPSFQTLASQNLNPSPISRCNRATTNQVSADDGSSVKFWLLVIQRKAAARALRVRPQPDFRLGNLHPVVQWAEPDIETDPQELAKIKIVFVRNLPVDADENYLKQLFEPCGKVEKVVVSKKGSGLPVGFVHFAERSDLERAIRDLNDKTVRGPKGGQLHKLEVVDNLLHDTSSNIETFTF